MPTIVCQQLYFFELSTICLGETGLFWGMELAGLDYKFLALEDDQIQGFLSLCLFYCL